MDNTVKYDRTIQPDVAIKHKKQVDFRYNCEKPLTYKPFEQMGIKTEYRFLPFRIS